jgi:NitT/TauT family transport system substrate-binding protein
MYIKIIISLFIALGLISCSSYDDNKLKISTTNWVGYTPLIYAKEKGWLKDLNIELVMASSLAENMNLYDTGNSDTYLGTQHEYKVLAKKYTSLKPIMILDRSNGGDLIMSNTSIKELQNTQKAIDAYLEIDSINYDVLKDFIKSYNLKNKEINYINKEQTQIEFLNAKDINNPTILVTYVPFNLTLEKNGFKKIVSTKESLNIFIIDAMFTKMDVFYKHKKQFIELKKILDKSIKSLEKNPKEFYKQIKPYMNNITYKEFDSMQKDIMWLNKELSPIIKNRLNDMNFPIRDII